MRTVATDFLENIQAMSAALSANKLPIPDSGGAEIYLADARTPPVAPESVDLVLTSPPYCTRIDYTAATRIELAVIAPLLQTSVTDLGRQMTGSVKVPMHDIRVSENWGSRCATFLKALREHSSKASSGYYYKTHLDYFDKMALSIKEMAKSMKPKAGAILVVQDSNYKELHNDVPTIIGEMAGNFGLHLAHRCDFSLSRTMALINPHTKRHAHHRKAVEAVLCFAKR